MVSQFQKRIIQGSTVLRRVLSLEGVLTANCSDLVMKKCNVNPTEVANRV